MSTANYYSNVRIRYVRYFETDGTTAWLQNKNMPRKQTVGCSRISSEKRMRVYPLNTKHQKTLVWQGKKSCETKEPVWRPAAESVRWEAPAAKHALWFCSGVEERRGEERGMRGEQRRGHCFDWQPHLALFKLPNSLSVFESFLSSFLNCEERRRGSRAGSAGIFWAAQPLAWWLRETCQMPV